MTSTPPRSIDGTIGSKIRIILGDTGDDWLLLLNHDDGNSKWQEQQWGGSIPNPLAKQINNCIAKDRYIKEVDFGPNGEWFVHGIKRDGSGGHSWWGGTLASSAIAENSSSSSRVQVSFGSDTDPEPSYDYDYDCEYDNDNKLETYAILQGKNGYQLSNSIDGDLTSRMKRIHTRKKSINFIRLFTDGAYFISDDEGTEWKGIGKHCGEEIQKNGKKEEVAIAADGNWVVIRSDRYIASTGVDDELSRHLTQFYNDQRERNNKRTLEIQEYHARIRREEARVLEEREEQERAERLALEAAQREELERRREREAAARERQQQREAAEREAREEKERASASRLTALLEERIIEELKDISIQKECLKKNFKTMKKQEEHLEKKKGSLQASIAQLPPQARNRIGDAGYDLANILWSPAITTTTNNASSSPAMANCVICQVAPSSQAIIPCGHICLCDDCATTLTDGPPQSRLCPLCRTRIQSCLQIYLSTG